MSFDAISPIDGRYRREAEPLSGYFSERALVKHRVRVELAYLGLLVKLGVAPRVGVPKSIDFSMEDFREKEDRVGHDVKAVELLIRERLNKTGKGALSPYVHLGLTSEDTNSLAFAVLLRSAVKDVLLPAYSKLAVQTATLAATEARTPMLARTHGRPAVPTTFGKEMAVFAVRLAERVSVLSKARPVAKFSGAVGTYASFSELAHEDWPRVLSRFVRGFDVGFAAYSTQVAPGEGLSDLLHAAVNINQLVLSLSRDLWLYQTLDYVRFQRPGKVSSSTMPQKVNPVDVENAEGQAEVSNSILVMLSYRLEVTRLQRDLSDSVLRRMVGQGLAHSFLAASRLGASLSSMKVDRARMKEDLGSHPEVMAEREQVRRRLAGDEEGYEKVKASLEKGRFAASADPEEYLGFAPDLAEKCPEVVRRILGS